MTEQDFKIIDKRASKGASDEPIKTGDGFTVKDVKAENKAQGAAEPLRFDFSTFTLSLATGAMINLGLVPDPSTRKTQKNLELAKQNIEILDLLKEKTRGNLTDDEGKLLENILTEVRLNFVKASR